MNWQADNTLCVSDPATLRAIASEAGRQADFHARRQASPSCSPSDGATAATWAAIEALAMFARQRGGHIILGISKERSILLSPVNNTNNDTTGYG